MPIQFRPVVPGGAGAAIAPPDFGRSVNPISTMGADNAHRITTGTPGFSDLPTALQLKEHYAIIENRKFREYLIKF